MFDSLCDPLQGLDRPWLLLLPDEVGPRVLEQVHPTLVVWSTLWPSRPSDRIRFDLGRHSGGSLLRWTLLCPIRHPAPDASKLGHLRKRLNTLINEGLRLSYGQ